MFKISRHAKVDARMMLSDQKFYAATSEPSSMGCMHFHLVQSSDFHHACMAKEILSFSHLKLAMISLQKVISKLRETKSVAQSQVAVWM